MSSEVRARLRHKQLLLKECFPTRDNNLRVADFPAGNG
jgi:hypothetical protein